jgi:hypothetical protein
MIKTTAVMANNVHITGFLPDDRPAYPKTAML